MSLLAEIREQPATLERVIALGGEAVSEVARLVASAGHVVIAARGTSDNAARYAQYVWGIRNGVSVGLATPSMYSLYRRPPRLDDALVIGISQSGESPDIVSVLEEGRRQSRPTVAITNEPSSPLAGTSDVVVALHAGEETAIAATKTYTAELATIALISETLDGRVGLLDRMPSVVGAMLGLEAQCRDIASDHSSMERAAVVGRGLNLATVFEWALKMQELSYVVAQPFSTADFLHGPVAVVDRGFPVLGVAVEGPTLDDVVGAMTRADARGAPTILITDSDQASRAVSRSIRFESAVEEWLSPIPSIVLAQLFTYWLTVAQGHDPDEPRGLHKVTRTT